MVVPGGISGLEFSSRAFEASRLPRLNLERPGGFPSWNEPAGKLNGRIVASRYLTQPRPQTSEHDAEWLKRLQRLGLRTPQSHGRGSPKSPRSPRSVVLEPLQSAPTSPSPSRPRVKKKTDLTARKLA